MAHTMFDSPVGTLTLTADRTGLTALCFPGHAAAVCHADADGAGFLTEACRWLEIYFSGVRPPKTPQLHLSGTPFQRTVWALLCEIPYGQTVTYGWLAARIAEMRGGRMSAQAVGGAVGRNPVSIIVPCHRVIGADGSLTGFGGGMDRKRFLLALEGVETVR